MLNTKDYSGVTGSQQLNLFGIVFAVVQLF